MRLSEEDLKRITQQEGYKEIDHSAYAVPADNDDYTYSEKLPDVRDFPTSGNRVMGKEKEKKRHKYGARKTEVDGVMFDSAAEAKRYQTLKLLESVGEITELTLQPEFTLQYAFEWDGKWYKGIKYKADFKYTTRDGQIVVEEIKGVETPVFKLKWKMLLYNASEMRSPFKFVIIRAKDVV